jgi:metal-responsive CopG/Arc/MetJ family transcriptional regulator
MPARKRESKLTYCGIPTEIMKLVDQVIESRKYGYMSRNQFVNEAVKMRLRELGYYR